MSLTKTSSGDTLPTPVQWIGRDGTPIQSEDDINQLNDNLREIYEVCQRAFTDAVQMGCSEDFMRIVLQNMVDSLKRSANANS